MPRLRAAPDAGQSELLVDLGDEAMERQVRWGILIVAALGLLVYLNAFG